MSEVVQFEIAEAAPGFREELRTLLFTSFGNRFDENDFEHGWAGRQFVIRDEGALVACCAVVPRTIYINEEPHRCGYLENVATLPDMRHCGLASEVVRSAMEFIATNFEFGALSTSKNTFYGRLGWETWRGRSFVRTSGGWRPTDDEHGGIMVLEVEVQLKLDLDRSIACEERVGDDW